MTPFIPSYAPSGKDWMRQVSNLNPALAKLDAKVGLSGQVSAKGAQAAMDALPDNGGTVIVNGDWSGLDPASLISTVNKPVVWEVGKDGSLPEGMPGCVVTRGYRDQPHENTAGTGSRPGSAFVRNIVASHTPDPAQANQQDSIIYAEGAVPSVDLPLSHEFAAFRFNMTSQAYQTGNPIPTLDVKGVQGVVVSDGGGAKARGARMTAFGINGSTGIITGGLFSAVRSGLIPTGWGGDGVAEFTSGVAGPYQSGDAALLAQVGPGIQAAINILGFAGKERPQYGLLQSRGALGLLPEVAVLGLHAGGNGDIIQIVASEEDSTEVAVWEKDGTVRAPAFRSNIASIGLNDNASSSFTLSKTSGLIFVQQENGSTAYALIFYRAAGGLVATSIAAGAGAVIGTGALPADDGTAKMDVYITANTLTIRNRLGGAATFSYTVL